jgi:hypothetical protein
MKQLSQIEVQQVAGGGCIPFPFPLPDPTDPPPPPPPIHQV